MGRVNPWRRWDYPHALGVDSVDGTSLTYAPDANLARLRSWHTRSASAAREHNSAT